MEQFCPLCQKMGQTKKIEQIQINEKESVIMCTEPECPWPFGYEKLQIIPRDFKLIPKPQKKKEKKKNTIEIDKLVLYTPPVTPNEDSTSGIDSMTLLTTQNYSAEPSNNEKLNSKSSLSSNNNKSIFDIDDSTIVPRKKLDNSIVEIEINKSKNCDNINKLVNKKTKSNGIKIRSNKRQKLDITKQVNGKECYVLKQKNESNEMVKNSTEINHDNIINLIDNSLPKIDNIVNENIINNNNNNLLELNCNSKSNHDADNQCIIDDFDTLFGIPSTNLPIENEHHITNNNSNNLADNLNGNNCASSELPDLDNLIFNELPQSTPYQTDELDEWLNGL